VKRATKKERQQLEAEKAVVLEQFENWISAKSEVSLIFFGPFFEYGWRAISNMRLIALSFCISSARRPRFGLQ